MPSVHRPVLLRETLAQLDLKPGLIVVDGTVGAGGHSQEILKQIQPGGMLIGLDRDPMMLAYAGERLDNSSVTLFHSSYHLLPERLQELGRSSVDRILLDLGLSSDQLADANRGFGIQAGGTLDMRFDTTEDQSLQDWLNQADEQELIVALENYGEEQRAEAIARAIVKARKASMIEDVSQLLEVLASVGIERSSAGQSHPATRIFQAFRIQVNRELEYLQYFLDQVAWQVLMPGGRLGVISFHSVEDRMVKRAFQKADRWVNLTKKPISASPLEQKMNPRSRSALLRIGIRAE